MPYPPLDSKAMVEICQELCAQASRLPKRRRFEFLATRIPDPILTAIVGATDAARRGNAGHEFESVLFAVGVEVRNLLYGRTAIYEIDEPGKASEWALQIGFALMLESARRKDSTLGVGLPTDPFSEMELKTCCEPVTRTMQARAKATDCARTEVPAGIRREFSAGCESARVKNYGDGVLRSLLVGVAFVIAWVSPVPIWGKVFVFFGAMFVIGLIVQAVKPSRT